MGLRKSSNFVIRNVGEVDFEYRISSKLQMEAQKPILSVYVHALSNLQICCVEHDCNLCSLLMFLNNPCPFCVTLAIQRWITHESFCIRKKTLLQGHCNVTS